MNNQNLFIIVGIVVLLLAISFLPKSNPLRKLYEGTLLTNLRGVVVSSFLFGGLAAGFVMFFGAATSHKIESAQLTHVNPWVCFASGLLLYGVLGVVTEFVMSKTTSKEEMKKNGMLMLKIFRYYQFAATALIVLVFRIFNSKIFTEGHVNIIAFSIGTLALVWSMFGDLSSVKKHIENI